MRIVKFFYLIFFLFSLNFCDKSNKFYQEYSSEFEGVPDYLVEKLLIMIPYYNQVYKDFEEELEYCRKNSHRIEISALQDFVNDNLKYEELCRRIKYEIIKIQFVKKEYDSIDFNSNIHEFENTKFYIKFFQIFVFAHVEKAKEKGLSLDEIDGLRRYIDPLKVINKMSASELESILLKIEFYFYVDRVFSEKNKEFLVNRFVENIDMINKFDENEPIYLIFYYYSMIHFLLQQKDEVLKKDAFVLFENARRIIIKLKKKNFNSIFFEKVEVLLESLFPLVSS